VLNLGGGFSGGTNHFIKSSVIPGAPVCDTSGSTTVYDDRLWAHEYGHYMGLAHVFVGDNDLLADTRPDPYPGSCSSPYTSPFTYMGQTIDADNIMAYYYNPLYVISPTQAAVVRQTAYARWY
jgi:hypothetical protein